MGVLDDAIREHIELKRQHGASDTDLERQEQEALGPARRGAPAPAEQAGGQHDAPVADSAAEPAEEDFEVAATEVVPPGAEPKAEPEPEPEGFIDADSEPAEEEDVLEETPEFLQETPEHDRLWFEQKPPRDFDFDQ